MKNKLMAALTILGLLAFAIIVGTVTSGFQVTTDNMLWIAGGYLILAIFVINPMLCRHVRYLDTERHPKYEIMDFVPVFNERYFFVSAPWMFVVYLISIVVTIVCFVLAFIIPVGGNIQTTEEMNAVLGFVIVTENATYIAFIISRAFIGIGSIMTYRWLEDDDDFNGNAVEGAVNGTMRLAAYLSFFIPLLRMLGNGAMIGLSYKQFDRAVKRSKNKRAGKRPANELED
jgi:hypothetical protein